MHNLTLAPLATKGYVAPEVEHTYARALELYQETSSCRTAGEIFPILTGLWIFYLVRAELQTAHEQEQGRRQEDQQILATFYEQFTEGFDTPDLLSARTLLAHWSESDPMN